MNDQQKALFKQLQLAGLGIVIAIFGFLVDHLALMIIGIGVFIFGILRTIVIKKLIKKLEEDN